MDLIIGLLVLCIVLGIVFWLLGMVVSGIPGAPPWLRSAIIALFALCALWWLFGGYSPFYHHALWR
jgi:hypothetical protein